MKVKFLGLLSSFTVGFIVGVLITYYAVDGYLTELELTIKTLEEK